MKIGITLTAILGLALSCFGQKIGFYESDNFIIEENEVAHYGLSLISGTGYRRVGLSGFFGLDFYTNGSEKMRISRDGNVGIGTKSPKTKLDLIGDLKIGNGANYQNLLFKTGSNVSGYNGVFEIRPSTISGSGTARYMTYFKNAAHSNGKTEHHVTIDGNLGIGTASPTEKLSVNGTIRSKEVKVEASPWPDYVFTAAYDLPTLEEVQNYITTKGHLPNIPSAKEVAENGIALGEMNAKLLEKIEELTLYTLEQEEKLREVETLKKEVQELKKMINKLIEFKNK